MEEGEGLLVVSLIYIDVGIAVCGRDGMGVDGGCLSGGWFGKRWEFIGGGSRCDIKYGIGVVINDKWDLMARTCLKVG